MTGIRQRASLALGLMAGILLLAGPRALSAPPQRPNTIVPLTDDQHYRSLGCMGNSQVGTPNPDRLASIGVTFDSHYCSTSICMASNASLMRKQRKPFPGDSAEYKVLTDRIWGR